MPFDPHLASDLTRYSRQLLLPEIGPTGQAALGRATAVVVGLGGLGCPAATYLAAAGVGRLVLVDGDLIEASNLHRQPLYGPDDVGQPKAAVAAARLAAAHPHLAIEAIARPWDATVPMGEVLLDATDNFPTRFALADACLAAGVPLVHAALTRFGGLLATFRPGGPCYRCFFPAPPAAGSVPGCGEAGVLGAAAGAVGSLAALEAVKVLVGVAAPPAVLVLDLWAPSMERVALPRDPACGCAAAAA